MNEALEVACGECPVTKDLLQGQFKYIDLFEPTKEAFEAHAKPLAAPTTFPGETVLITAKRARLEDFKPVIGKDYDLIVMRYCLGYVSDN